MPLLGGVVVVIRGGWDQAHLCQDWGHGPLSMHFKKITSNREDFAFVHSYLKVRTLDEIFIRNFWKTPTRMLLPSERGCVTLKPFGKSVFCVRPSTVTKQTVLIVIIYCCICLIWMSFRQYKGAHGSYNNFLHWKLATSAIQSSIV